MTVISLFVALAATAAPPAPRLTADDVRAIRATCKVPKSWIWYRAGGVYMKPPSRDPEEKIECMLREVSKNYPSIGLVGNERY